MKDYYIFPHSGESIKITKHNDIFTLSFNHNINYGDITIDKNQITINTNDPLNHARFTKETLLDALQKMMKHVEKYG